MYAKQLVILAKSYKQGAWCIAGREISFNAETNTYSVLDDWIRPVSDDDEHHGAVSDDHCAYDDGSIPRIYDLVEIDFLEGQVESGQPENELISANPWRKIGSIRPDGIHNFKQEPDDIWNEMVGRDYVSEQYEQQGNIENSLVIIRPENFQIHLTHDQNEYTGQYKKEIRASFDYEGVHYEHISITDPAIRKMLGRQYPDQGGDEVVTTLRKGDDCYLCLSLGPAWTDYNRHYKLVATIFDFDGYIQRTYG